MKQCIECNTNDNIIEYVTYEVDSYHYFKDNTTIYYCYNCEVWTY